MGDLSENFSRHEFACKCGCGFDTVDAATLDLLERVRARCGGHPVTIHSGCRCPAYNKKVGGSPNSQHLVGRAADISIEGVPHGTVHAVASSALGYTGGLGSYATFNHLDTRTDGSARWIG